MIDRTWIRVKSRQTMTHTLLNLGDLVGKRLLDTSPDLLSGVPAFVVGAGYDLEHNGHLLPECARRGIVLATNSSDYVCRHYGVTPDVVVVRESLDVSDQVALSQAPILALDVSVHPNTLAAAGDRAAVWLPAYPRHYEICRLLDHRPVEAGTASLTAAVQLAIDWGCSPIVLVGCGNAIRVRDGATYHPAAPRGAMKARLHQQNQRMIMTGTEADDARHDASGQIRQGTDVAATWVGAWGGKGSVPVTSVLLDQIDWLAERRDHTIAMLCNCSEEGAAIPGWTSQKLADFLEKYAHHEHENLSGAVWGPELSDEDMYPVWDYVRRGVHALESIAREFARPRPRAINLVHSGLDEVPELVEGLGGAEILAAHDENPNDAHKRSEALIEAWRKTAEAARMIVESWSHA